MYSWIAIISFLYYGRNKANPFEFEHPAKSEDETRATKSPFSRSSTLSVRGRRSFLLKARTTKEENAPGEDTGLLGESERETSDVMNSNFSQSESIGTFSDENRSSGLQYANPSPPQPRHKRIKGFVPDVLKFSDSNSSKPNRRSKNRSSEKVDTFC